MRRRRRSREETEHLIEQYRTSGLTQADYSRQNGMALSTLGRYLRRDSGTRRLVRVRVKDSPDADDRLIRVAEAGQAMFGLGPATKIYLGTDAIDMRNYAPSRATKPA